MLLRHTIPNVLQVEVHVSCDKEACDISTLIKINVSVPTINTKYL